MRQRLLAIQTSDLRRNIIDQYKYQLRRAGMRVDASSGRIGLEIANALDSRRSLFRGVYAAVVPQTSRA